LPTFRIFDPYAFLRDEDRPAASAKAANPAKAGAGESGTLATLAALAGALPEIEERARPNLVGQKVWTEPPLLLANGRRLHRFHADAVLSSVPSDTAVLLAEARWHGAVLVADGAELIVVERWRSTLPSETLATIKSCAGAMIAALRGESRRRCARLECGASDDKPCN
jgi:hypothetical protein